MRSRSFPLVALVAALALQGCSLSSLEVKRQKVPEHALVPKAAEFQAPADVAVLHYYGAGGWGIRWRGNYLLAAPYFSNHGIPRLLASRATSAVGVVPQAATVGVVPDVAAVRAGFAGTPVGDTNVILIGHGHVDHSGDVPAFFGEGLVTKKPVLIADRSTTNELAALKEHFGCISPIDFDAEDAAPQTTCPLEGVRITPIHHAHAPHLNLVGLDVAAFGGFVKEPRTTAPAAAEDYKLGNTWAYLIDLLDEKGEIAFRIHYVDAAASPPHAIVPRRLLAARDVDVHIACVPGFEQSDDYPDAVLRHHNVRYVLAGHWEDFFQPRTDTLTPLRHVLDGAALERFVDIVEHDLPENRGVAPLNKSPKACQHEQCGPSGKTWSLPVPGETFQFATGPQAPASRLEDPFAHAAK